MSQRKAWIKKCVILLCYYLRTEPIEAALASPFVLKNKQKETFSKAERKRSKSKFTQRKDVQFGQGDDSKATSKAKVISKEACGSKQEPQFLGRC